MKKNNIINNLLGILDYSEALNLLSLIETKERFSLTKLLYNELFKSTLVCPDETPNTSFYKNDLQNKFNYFKAGKKIIDILNVYHDEFSKAEKSVISNIRHFKGNKKMKSKRNLFSSMIIGENNKLKEIYKVLRGKEIFKLYNNIDKILNKKNDNKLTSDSGVLINKKQD